MQYTYQQGFVLFIIFCIINIQRYETSSKYWEGKLLVVKHAVQLFSDLYWDVSLHSSRRNCSIYLLRRGYKTNSRVNKVHPTSNKNDLFVFRNRLEWVFHSVTICHIRFHQFFLLTLKLDIWICFKFLIWHLFRLQVTLWIR